MKNGKEHMGSAARPYEPSPRDIRRACDDIQESWSERERKKRSGRRSGTSGWMPPSVKMSSLTEAADDAYDSLTSPNGATAREFDG